MALVIMSDTPALRINNCPNAHLANLGNHHHENSTDRQTLTHGRSALLSFTFYHQVQSTVTGTKRAAIEQRRPIARNHREKERAHTPKAYE